MRQFLFNRPAGRAILTASALIVVLALAGATYIWVTGAPGASGSSGTLSVATLPPNPNAITFTIDPSGTEAKFTMTEVHFGQNATVVATTNQVSGQIQIDSQHPDQSRVGVIKIDLSTLATDDEFRNRTMRSRILETSDPANQYATFAPKTITGLPTSAAIGQHLNFQITGDLTIHQVTHSLTFDVTATAVSDSKLTGTAKATIKYADYNISIPDVPNVSNVSDTVQLELDFTAKK